MTLDTWIRRCRKACQDRKCSQECLGIGFCREVMEAATKTKTPR